MSLPVAQPWFSVEPLDGGIVMLSEPHVARLWRANMFFVRGRDSDLLVDTGMGVGSLRDALVSLGALGSRKLTLLTTHAHIDHIGGHAEFAADTEILIHAAEQAALAAPVSPSGLDYATLSPAVRANLAAAGFVTSGLMIDAVPQTGYDAAAHRIAGVAATRTIGEGEVIDLGDRRFGVLHLPGHSPGSIGLWEADSATLIAGDAIYDGILVDTLEGADIPVYLETMKRLRALPVHVVLGGHRRPFGRARMVEIIDAYRASRRTGRPPAPDFPLVAF